MRCLRPVIIAIGLLLAWELVVRTTGAPPYILPGPAMVLATWLQKAPMIGRHAFTTTVEIGAGLALGTLVGCASALLMAYFAPVRRWLMPVLVVSQAIPVFALAPLLVLWMGYGLASKVAMATLIIYFPVTATFYDGLRRTEPGWIELARTMSASRLAILRHIRLPAALPSLASGLRVAAAVAPIGAVVGEWVGSSTGLGYLMLHANARMQVDVVFAALLTLAVISVTLYFAIDAAMRRLMPWQPETITSHDG